MNLTTWCTTHTESYFWFVANWKEFELSVWLGNNRKFGSVQSRRKTADVIFTFHSTWQETKTNFNVCRESGQGWVRNSTRNLGTLHEQSFINIYLITRQCLYNLVIELHYETFCILNTWYWMRFSWKWNNVFHLNVEFLNYWVSGLTGQLLLSYDILLRICMAEKLWRTTRQIIPPDSVILTYILCTI